MDLILDIGNTRTKYLVGKHLGIVEEFTQEAIDELFTTFKDINSCIISSVKNLDSNLINYISKKVSVFILFNQLTPIPIINLYAQPENLGKDRLAGVIGAYTIFPNEPVLVVDLGTAITFDFIDSNKNYLGGTISPGLNTRFKSLNLFTDKLPLCEPNDSEYLFAANTEDAIVSGVQNGIIFEIEGYINAFSKKYPKLKTIITGGDSINFAKKLKKPIFAEPNLIFIGLKTILKYNAKN
ncbi:MAG: type III pantothenate kinase [Bacteroidales bacterium]|nr:type III pantothenate kinase [Bacteroidales bacterium]